MEAPGRAGKWAIGHLLPGPACFLFSALCLSLPPFPSGILLMTEEEAPERGRASPMEVPQTPLASVTYRECLRHARCRSVCHGCDGRTEQAPFSGSACSHRSGACPRAPGGPRRSKRGVAGSAAGPGVSWESTGEAPLSVLVGVSCTWLHAIENPVDNRKLYSSAGP